MYQDIVDTLRNSAFVVAAVMVVFIALAKMLF